MASGYYHNSKFSNITNHAHKLLHYYIVDILNPSKAYSISYSHQNLLINIYQAIFQAQSTKHYVIE